MTIGQLKKTHPKLAALAVSLYDIGNEPRLDSHTLGKMFIWEYTPQNFDFWDDVDNGIDLDQKEAAL